MKQQDVKLDVKGEEEEEMKLEVKRMKSKRKGS